MRLLCTSLFLSYIVAFTICVQGCRPTRIETFAFEKVYLDNEVVKIPYRNVILPLPLPPSPRGNFNSWGKDAREFAYIRALKGWAPIFVLHPLEPPNEDYAYVTNNRYIATFTERNQIIDNTAAMCDYFLDEVFNIPVAYMAECEATANNTLIVKAQFRRLSVASFNHFSTHPIESCTSAVILFTQKHIYIKSYSDKCFRRYHRKPYETEGRNEWN